MSTGRITRKKILIALRVLNGERQPDIASELGVKAPTVNEQYLQVLRELLAPENVSFPSDVARNYRAGLITKIQKNELMHKHYTVIERRGPELVAKVEKMLDYYPDHPSIDVYFEALKEIIESRDSTALNAAMRRTHAMLTARGCKIEKPHRFCDGPNCNT